MIFKIPRYTTDLQNFMFIIKYYINNLILLLN